VDARGQKGQWEALINYKDAAENKIMEVLSKRAQYFEDRMPWKDEFKRKKIALPVSKAINLVAAYPQPPAGINLPNEQHIRQKHGSKSVLVANVMETAAVVRRMPLGIELAATPEERELSKKYTATARKLIVALHEVTGHASGQVAKTLKGDPASYLKEYDNTLEEARADLVALWHAFDPALADWNPEYEQIAQQMYRDFLAQGLTDLARVTEGSQFEEDHQRGQHMSVSFLIEKGAVKVEKVPQPAGSPLKSKTYYRVSDFAKMREAVGELATRLMEIKATGDYEGIKALVNRLGVNFDPVLRDEIVARVKSANVPTTLFLNMPRLSPTVDAKGALADVAVQHDQELIHQHLERSLLGTLPAKQASKVAAAARTLEDLKGEFKKLRPSATSGSR
jgi:dipeptidyl-peptidase III